MAKPRWNGEQNRPRSLKSVKKGSWSWLLRSARVILMMEPRLERLAQTMFVMALASTADSKSSVR